MTGAGIGEDALAWMIGRRRDGGERLPELALEHSSRRLHGDTRREAGLEVCPQREAHERRMGQRLTTVSGDVADDDRQPAVIECEQIIEVPARPGTVRRPVGRGGADRTEPSGQHRKQRGLKQADVLEQLPTLALQSPGAQRGQARAERQRQREREQTADESPHQSGYHADDSGDRRHDRRLAARRRWAVRGLPRMTGPRGVSGRDPRHRRDSSRGQCGRGCMRGRDDAAVGVPTAPVRAPVTARITAAGARRPRRPNDLGLRRRRRRGCDGRGCDRRRCRRRGRGCGDRRRRRCDRGGRGYSGPCGRDDPRFARGPRFARSPRFARGG